LGVASVARLPDTHNCGHERTRAKTEQAILLAGSGYQVQQIVIDSHVPGFGAGYQGHTCCWLLGGRALTLPAGSGVWGSIVRYIVPFRVRVTQSGLAVGRGVKGPPNVSPLMSSCSLDIQEGLPKMKRPCGGSSSRATCPTVVDLSTCTITASPESQTLHEHCTRLSRSQCRGRISP
jgi:hypothetical protein